MKSVTEKVEENRKYANMEKVPYSIVQKNYKKIWKYMYPVYISLFGMVISFPLWIWVSWTLAWKVFLTSLFLFLVSNGVFNVIKKSFIIYQEHLDKIDKIDYTK